MKHYCLWCKTAWIARGLCAECVTKQESTGLPFVVDLQGGPLPREPAQLGLTFWDEVGGLPDRFVHDPDRKVALIMRGEDAIGYLQNYADVVAQRDCKTCGLPFDPTNQVLVKHHEHKGLPAALKVGFVSKEKRMTPREAFVKIRELAVDHKSELANEFWRGVIVEICNDMLRVPPTPALPSKTCATCSKAFQFNPFLLEGSCAWCGEDYCDRLGCKCECGKDPGLKGLGINADGTCARCRKDHPLDAACVFEAPVWLDETPPGEEADA